MMIVSRPSGKRRTGRYILWGIILLILTSPYVLLCMNIIEYPDLSKDKQ